MGEQSACVEYGRVGVEVWGGHSEYAIARAITLEKVPKGIDLDHVACAGTWLTAWRMLVTVAHAQPGETVLIIGASGGVGTGGIKIAKFMGCRVIAVVGGTWKVKRAMEEGADYAVDHTTQDFQQMALELTNARGVDVVMNAVGGRTWRKSINSLRRFGRMVICGAAGGDTPEISIREIYVKHRQILSAPRGNRVDYRNLLRCLFDGRLHPVIHIRLPLEEIHLGLQMLERRDFFGKIILNP
jgi:NADPH:quinone reductase-like Zn-dependent oxidoreductase